MTGVADFWDEQAATFDDAPDHGLRDPLVRAAWEQLLTPLLPEERSLIADLGCGTGSLALLIAAAGHDVHACDLSPAMVELARAKAKAAELSAEFVVADAAAPPWPMASFDLIVCRHVLWALEDPAAALERWVGLLKPAGTLVMIEGRWWTGVGMTAPEVVELLARAGHGSEVTPLSDPALWGQAVTDERYLVRCSPDAR